MTVDSIGRSGEFVNLVTQPRVESQALPQDSHQAHKAHKASPLAQLQFQAASPSPAQLPAGSGTHVNFLA